MRTIVFTALFALASLHAAEPLRIAVFAADATGMPVAYVTARSITDPLSARGVVFMGNGKPVGMMSDGAGWQRRRGPRWIA